ncbi:DUF4303 domain-containing protein [Solibacillus sp. MA9]|uniref:DUF4303 domain-containing protein n=1 Tax=Solibacillus palustris TaxID=2908203 RepID=A0ABS9UJA6_9BACL|nr:DUF4303 domain-containing protein [Solibacillus sp. MA9]MCH7324010.1 DUF4303 domain-containing protein [Solibacillus sp. MA9]
MSYDVQIGRLISGRREVEGKGTYLQCTTDQTIQEISTFGPEDGLFISRKDLENALYDFCKSAISNYIKEESNEDVYTFSIYTDSYHSSYLVYINDQATLEEVADDCYTSYQENYLKTGKKIYNETKEQVYHSCKFSEGDYAFMFDEMPDQLESYLETISCVIQETPDYLRNEKNYIFEKTIIDSELFLIAIDVIHRLQNDLKKLNQTEDFIAYVSAADGVGGDYLTLSQLIRKCVPEDQLYKAMPDLKDKDLEFQAAVEATQQLLIAQQVKHWVTVIERGEFGKGSMRSFWRTDYDAYEQLVKLGHQVIPYIQDHLNGELKNESREILMLVLDDLKK